LAVNLTGFIPSSRGVVDSWFLPFPVQGVELAANGSLSVSGAYSANGPIFAKASTAFGEAVMGGVKVFELANLTASQLAQFSLQDIQALSTTRLASLSPAQLSGLCASQLAAMSETQLSTLNYWQILE
jgi:hypothetical protein